MLIVGELINTSRSQVKSAVEEKDAEFIKKLAHDQIANGAHYIDVNCGTMIHNEEETMRWLVETVQEAVEAPLCIDSPNPKALAVRLSLCRFGQPMVNSITAEEERFSAVLPLVLEYKCKVVALCMDDTGMPETAEDRFAIVDKLIANLTKAGVAPSDIYIDPLVKPLSTNDRAALEVLETVEYIRQNHPDVHIICGMSNISYGLPQRKLLNQAFFVQLMTVGMDSTLWKYILPRHIILNHQAPPGPVWQSPGGERQQPP
ncbi:MAG TPA: methyltetrahydrofolate--corrinoid methyltransferase [Peptococcaceae bacterium]|nr:methyltetrahydrofolate--corrinoid methyltransferase [Peptococcaceae bacterium]